MTIEFVKLDESMQPITAKSCADKIKGELESLNAELKELMSNPDNDELSDPALSVDNYQLTTICLSYGGPSSYLEVKHQGNDIHTVTYRYSDWFDTATLPVFDSEPAYEYACNIVWAQDNE